LRTIWFLLAVAIACFATPADAQTRKQAVHLVFPFGAGGLSDALTRLIADELSAGLGRPVVVEMRPGAAGRIGVRAVKAARPDGNTLMLAPIAPMTVYRAMYPSLEYDPVRDFAPITQVATYEFAIAVGIDVPARTLPELVAWIRTHPAQANYGIPGAGTLPHFFGALFGRAIGVELQPVAYSGTPSALADLVGGRIPMLFHAANELVEMHKAGAIRILATSDRQRSPMLPDVPTFLEAKFELEGAGWYGLFAPAGTPAETVARINMIMVEALAKAALRDRLLALGLRPTGTSAEEFARIQQGDIDRWAPALEASGFVPAL
jgi:tripartite-type tricarboxylate transporter receptor subunit TctC